MDSWANPLFLSKPAHRLPLRPSRTFAPFALKLLAPSARTAYYSKIARRN
jgi:hypothetical protein